MTKTNVKKAIAAYEKQCETAMNRLVAKIEPALIEACEKWGLDFRSGMGLWSIGFDGNHYKQRYRKDALTGNYYELGDARWLLDFLEPELVDALETSVDRECLGNWMNDVTPSKKRDWVVIEADDACLDEKCDVPKILASVSKIDDQKIYFGWLSRNAAEAIVNEYSEDWESGSQLLASLHELEKVDCHPLLNETVAA